MATRQWIMSSPVGLVHLMASEHGLHGIFWKKQTVPLLVSLDETSAEAKIISNTIQQLNEYFVGKRTAFDLPLAPEGTDFQRKVWAALAEIPYGKTVSYSDVARRIKKPLAVRAVGAANGRNPLSIVVPCHRVIASSGKLQGYAGGLETKRQLLAIEGIP